MGSNGSRHGQRQNRTFDSLVQTLSPVQRFDLFVWLHGWRRRPARVFWVFDLDTLTWRRL